MPQIQPGQVTPGQNGAPKMYGVDKTENTVPFQEKLMRLFKPQEFVTIKNIDDAPLYWQYMPADNEQENFSEDGMQKMINRDAPEMWVINPGEVEVLVGASAYRALDTLYKNYTAKRTLKKFADPTQPQFNENNEHLPKNFNFADGGAQDDFIALAYLGKAQPVFGPQQPAPEAFAPPVAAQPAPQAAPAPQVADPTVPVPNTTDGAPLAPVTYAEPDAPAPAPQKELTNAGTSKV
jgi:hypothetical protein